MFTFQALLARRQALFMLAALAGAGLSRAETEVYKTIDWNDLMPDPWVKEMSKDMAAMSKLSYLQDSSDEATKAMSAIRKKLDEAPIVKTQLNKKVRIPGYAVPLDAERSDKREFLLVPYFGACIHTPPPPANQIVLVRPTAQSKIKKMPESMDVLWVEGELKEGRVSTGQGVSGYLLEAVSVAPYETKPVKR
ncbi:MAG: DUF3299 domain-containing protein [Betaproteobacteria bacterium]|jgi:hypothetical protein|nr:DUF3299 domain-containing protein [Burkholderiales bacterium]